MDTVYELDGEIYKRKNGKWLSSTNCVVPIGIASKLNSKYPICVNETKKKKAKSKPKPKTHYKEKRDALDHRVSGNFWTH